MKSDSHSNPADSQLAWTNSAPHREQLRKMLVQVGGDRRGELCVWGAGPCNDLDLDTLRRHFRHITLVDMDSATLNAALRVRQLDQSDQITAVGGLDLSGVHSLVDQYRNHSDKDLLHRIQRTASQHELDLPDQFDVLISTCLLSQIFVRLVRALEDQAREMVETLQIVRRRHLELMLRHTRPGGAAILVTDVTSSDALPELLEPNPDVDQLLRDKIFHGNHFHGLNPLSIDQTIRSEPSLNSRIDSFQVSRPWIWNATARSYCCLAFLMNTRETAAC